MDKFKTVDDREIPKDNVSKEFRDILDTRENEGTKEDIEKAFFYGFEQLDICFREKYLEGGKKNIEIVMLSELNFTEEEYKYLSGCISKCLLPVLMKISRREKGGNNENNYQN